MVSRNAILPLFLTLLAMTKLSTAGAEAPTSTLVQTGADGRLVYAADGNGNRLPDFSHAGYGGGGVPLPRVPAAVTVTPGPGDDGARIQSAIDAVARRSPDDRGIRGAVVLAAGKFQVAGSLFIRASGVVLRGAGAGADGTVLLATGRDKRRLIVAAPQAGTRIGRERSGTRRRVADGHVPLGARAVSVDDATPYRVGDVVVVERPSTAAWISSLGMDRLPPRRNGGKVVQWQAGKFNIPYQRSITAIEGNRIYLDAPLFHALDPAYGGGIVYAIETGDALRNVGIENIRAVSATDGSPDDEDHAWTFIFMDGLTDGWVSGIVAEHFAYAAVHTGRHSTRITVRDSANLSPVSRITGGRRYAFHLQGQLHLALRLYARDGRHDFVTGRQWSSGIVFLYCLAEGAHAPSEPHHRYSTGILYDNVTMRKSRSELALALWNRGNKGTGHGWAAANSVIWNARVDGGIAVEHPPGAQNYCIGCRSDTMSAGLDGRPRNLSATSEPRAAHWEHWNQGPVAPLSLYEAQLRDRLGPAALDALDRPQETPR